MNFIYAIIIFIVAIAVLVKSSDYFVESIAKIAKLLGVSEFIIGLSVVAIGTSLPELITSLIAAGIGNTELVVGNIVGSNIANIGLILGISAVVLTLHITARMYAEDISILAVVTLVFFFFGLDGVVSRLEGIILLFFFLLYLIYLFKFKKLPKKEEAAIEKGGFKLQSKLNKATFKELTIAALSLVGLIYSAKFVVSSSTDIAVALGVPLNVIAVTMIALGTSLPELVVAISTLKKGLNDLLIGNVLGSNIINILLIGGLGAIIQPLTVNFYSVLISLPALILIMSMLMFFMRTKHQLVKYEGIILIAFYVIFIVTVWVFSA